MTNKSPLRSVALCLVLLLTAHTIPLSASDAASKGIGQITAIGAVDLRGVHISGDGTLFSGDRLNVGKGGYARVVLAAGPRIEVDRNSDVTVTKKDDGKVFVQVASGNVAFRGDGKASVKMLLGAYEVTVPGNASGNVAYVGRDAFGVRVLTGSVSVFNSATKESFTVKKGNEQLVSLTTGAMSPTMAKIASNAPSAVPALPQPRRRDVSAGTVVMIGTLVGAGAAIAVLVSRNNDSSASAAKRLAQTTQIANLSAISVTASQTATVAAQVNVTADAALTAINSSTSPNKAVLAQQATAVKSKANSAATKVANLTSQITLLENEASTQDGGLTPQQEAQLNQLLADLEIARKEANDAISLLNDLLGQAQANNIGGLPSNPGLQNVGGPNITSASAPDSTTSAFK